MNEIAALVAGYAAATYDQLESGRTRALPATTAIEGRSPGRCACPTLPSTNGRLLLTTSRTLYTSRDGAAIHSEEADKLHREEFLEINPADAAALGIGQNRPVVVTNGSHELTGLGGAHGRGRGRLGLPAALLRRRCRQPAAARGRLCGYRRSAPSLTERPEAPDFVDGARDACLYVGAAGSNGPAPVGEVSDD